MHIPDPTWLFADSFLWDISHFCESSSLWPQATVFHSPIWLHFKTYVLPYPAWSQYSSHLPLTSLSCRTLTSDSISWLKYISFTMILVSDSPFPIPFEHFVKRHVLYMYDSSQTSETDTYMETRLTAIPARPTPTARHAVQPTARPTASRWGNEKSKQSGQDWTYRSSKKTIIAFIR